MKSILILCLLYAYSLTCSAELSIITFNGKVSGNMACTMDCGNCCTGRIVSDLSNSLTISIGSSDVKLDVYGDDKLSHLIKGYYYNGSGSCGMNSCSFFHITSIDKENDTRYKPQTGKLTISSVFVDEKKYSATLSAPFSIDDHAEIVGQSGDCSQGQHCMEGYSCTSYHGISGMEFNTCEIPCIEKKYCPAGTSCLNIADGPQNICQ